MRPRKPFSRLKLPIRGIHIQMLTRYSVLLSAVDEENKEFDLADGESICVVRDSEWNKIMNFVKENSYD